MILAGIAGSMLALTYTRPLSPLKAVYASIGGTGAAIFLAPAIASGLSEEFIPAVSFLIGVFSMSILGVVFQVIERIKSEPIKTISNIVSIVIDVLLAVKGQNRRKDDE